MEFLYPSPEEPTTLISSGAQLVPRIRVEPDLADIIHHLIAALASHPRIIKPEIYYPQIDGDPLSTREVLIEEYREFSGLVLDQPGLTCSIYPYHTSRNPETDSPSSSMKKSVNYMPYNLGRAGRDSQDVAMFRIMIELSLQDNALAGDSFAVLKTIPNAGSIISKSYGQQVALQRDGDDLLADDMVRGFNPGQPIVTKRIRFRANPAEQILRRYVTLLRQVVRELPYLLPFSTRTLTVDDVDFCTNSWNQAGNIYFHVATLGCTLQMYVANP